MLLSSLDLKINTLSEDSKKGVFSFEPLPKGFGHTIGNSLKRVILTSLEGAAITQVKVAGVDHQFSTIPGVKEDVVEFTMNLKRVRVKSYSENPIVVNINKKGPGPVTAGDIETTSEVEILNKELVLANLADKNSVLKVELIVEKGVGYSPMEERQSAKIGVIVIDAIYTPIINVLYGIEQARFGKNVDLDKLVLTVETDGSIKPSDAVIKSAQILKDFFTGMEKWTDTSTDDKKDAEDTKAEKPVSGEKIAIEELPLPTRTVNALKKQGIDTLDQLANKTDEELADIKNLGEKSVEEIKKLLKKEGLL